MMEVWCMLRSLSRELVRFALLPLITVSDIVVLDTALANKFERAVFHAMLAESGPISLSYNSMIKPSWFWSKGIAVCGEWTWTMSDTTDEFTSGVANLKLTSDEVRLFAHLIDSPSLESMKKNAQLVRNSTEFAKKVTSLCTIGISSDLIGQNFPELRNVECYFWEDFSAVVGMILCNPKLTSVSVDTWVPDGSYYLFNAISQRGTTLVQLDLTCSKACISADHLSVLGAHCHKLESFRLQLTKQQSQPVYLTAAQMEPLAQGCQQLKSVKLIDACQQDAILVFAQHCHRLREYYATPSVNLTASVLAALQCNCLDLENVSDAHFSPTQAEIARYQSVFNRLMRFTVKFTDSETEAQMAMVTAVFLPSLSTATVSDHAPLAQVSPRPKLQSLRLDGQVNVPPEMMVGIVRAYTNLRSLSAYYSAIISDPLLLALGECCPHLESLIGDVVRGGVTDDAVIALAHGCRWLRSLHMLAGAVTDAAMEALARHCTKLHDLHIAGCTAVTDGAIVQLLLRCKKLRSIFLAARPLDIFQKTIERVGIKVTCAHTSLGILHVQGRSGSSRFASYVLGGDANDGTD